MKVELKVSHKFEGVARYKLKEYSQEKFQKFEELSLEKISQELNSFLNQKNNSVNENNSQYSIFRKYIFKNALFPKKKYQIFSDYCK